MKKETFSQARDRLLAELKEQGWAVVTRNPSGGAMKVPHATSPGYGRENVRVWFKTQSVYFSRGGTDLGTARSMMIDTRGMNVNVFIAAVARDAMTRHVPIARVVPAPTPRIVQRKGFTFINEHGHKILRLPKDAPTFSSEARRRESEAETATLARDMSAHEADDIAFREGKRGRDTRYTPSTLTTSPARASQKAEDERLIRYRAHHHGPSVREAEAEQKAHDERVASSAAYARKHDPKPFGNLTPRPKKPRVKKEKTQTDWLREFGIKKK